MIVAELSSDYHQAVLSCGEKGVGSHRVCEGDHRPVRPIIRPAVVAATTESNCPDSMVAAGYASPVHSARFYNALPLGTEPVDAQLDPITGNQKHRRLPGRTDAGRGAGRRPRHAPDGLQVTDAQFEGWRERRIFDVNRQHLAVSPHREAHFTLAHRGADGCLTDEVQTDGAVLDHGCQRIVPVDAWRQSLVIPDIESGFEEPRIGNSTGLFHGQVWYGFSASARPATLVLGVNGRVEQMAHPEWTSSSVSPPRFPTEFRGATARRRSGNSTHTARWVRPS